MFGPSGQWFWQARSRLWVLRIGPAPVLARAGRNAWLVSVVVVYLRCERLHRTSVKRAGKEPQREGNGGCVVPPGNGSGSEEEAMYLTAGGKLLCENVEWASEGTILPNR